jgi:hypothetical protein
MHAAEFFEPQLKNALYGAVTHPALPGLEINFVSKAYSLFKTLFADWPFWTQN